MPVFPGPAILAAGSFDNTGATGALRASGFASTWTVTTAGGTVWGSGVVGAIGPLIAAAAPALDPLFPLTITIDGGATGTDAYAWYLSQRSDGARYVLADGTMPAAGQPQYFTIAHPMGTKSGTVIIGAQSAQIAALFPGSGGTPPTDAASLAMLFVDCALYVSRASDSSYQWARFVAPPVG